MLQTTIAGSLPKPAWLATPGVLWAPWQLPPERLAEGQRDAVLLALHVATERAETPEEVAATIRRVLEFVQPGRLHPCTN